MTSALAAWLPKSVLALRDYDRHKFLSDLIAGVTVGMVALPLAMAFAIASGVTPQAGLYCAIVTGFLISALGGSKTQIGGPTGAFVVVVSGIIAKYGLDGLFAITMMAGVLLLILGLTGMGSAVKYFPRPVIIGFTNGIAILIASTQIRDFFGLKMDHVPGLLSSHERLRPIVAHDFATCDRARSHFAGDYAALHALREANTRSDCCHVRSHHRRDPSSLAGRDDRHPIRRDSLRSPPFCDSEIALQRPERAVIPRTHGSHARRNRVAHVRRCFRSDEQRQAQPQCGADGPRHCQYRLSAVWRTTRHRGNRSHSD